MELAEVQKKYAGKFEITESDKGWLKVRALTPTYDNHPSINAPAFLDYNIEKKDTRPGATLEDRSRNVWLRARDGRGFTHASYCGGMGIWQVSEDGTPQAFDDLSSESQRMVQGWLKSMDDYVKKQVPELTEILTGDRRPQKVRQR